MQLKLSGIQIDDRILLRSVNEGVALEYARCMLDGDRFPPIDVFRDGCWLADGRHRVRAAQLARMETIEANLISGDFRKALQFALSANSKHGMPRTNAEKRLSVERALRDPEWTAWNNTKIARLCQVSDKLVATVREELVLSGDINEPDTVKEVRGGQQVHRKASRAHSKQPSPPPIYPIGDEPSRQYAQLHESLTRIHREFHGWPTPPDIAAALAHDEASDIRRLLVRPIELLDEIDRQLSKRSC